MASTREVLIELAQNYPGEFSSSAIEGRDSTREDHQNGLPLQLPGDILPGDADITDIAIRFDTRKPSQEIDQEIDLLARSDKEVAQVLGYLVGRVEEIDKLPIRGEIRI